MSQTYGIQAPQRDRHEADQPPARYLVLIDSAGMRVGRLFLADRTQVAEFAAASEEVAQIISGLQSDGNASAAAWDAALAGSSAQERAAAEVYTLAT